LERPVSRRYFDPVTVCAAPRNVMDAKLSFRVMVDGRARRAPSRSNFTVAVADRGQANRFT
jgi:hypothetical protein